MNHSNQMVRKIAIIGMLLAAQVVAGMFISIRTPWATIGFTFLPLSLTAILYGPFWGAAAAVMGDFLIATLGPYGYYPPMATTALLSGLVFGLFLYKKPLTIQRVTLCVLVEAILCSILVQTFWISTLTGKGYFVLLPVRIFQNLVTTPVSIVCIRLVGPRVLQLADKLQAVRQIPNPS